MGGTNGAPPVFYCMLCWPEGLLVTWSIAFTEKSYHVSSSACTTFSGCPVAPIQHVYVVHRLAVLCKHGCPRKLVPCAPFHGYTIKLVQRHGRRLQRESVSKVCSSIAFSKTWTLELTDYTVQIYNWGGQSLSNENLKHSKAHLQQIRQNGRDRNCSPFVYTAVIQHLHRDPSPPNHQ